MIDLSNRTALITGSSRGLGRATALRLADAGARVIVHYSSNRQAADEVVTQIKSQGGVASAIGIDLSAADGAHRLAEEVKAQGITKLDILVANAGAFETNAFAEQTLEGFDRLFAVNTRAPYFLVQQLLPLFHGGASIVLLSSIMARTALDQGSAYSASKAAIEVMARNLAKELGTKRIRVNAIAPGAIDTDMAAEFLNTEENRQSIMAVQALKRIGQPDDIADVAVFLASDMSRWVTGRMIEVSGGSYL